MVHLGQLSFELHVVHPVFTGSTTTFRQASVALLPQQSLPSAVVFNQSAIDRFARCCCFISRTVLQQNFTSNLCIWTRFPLLPLKACSKPRAPTPTAQGFDSRVMTRESCEFTCRLITLLQKSVETCYLLFAKHHDGHGGTAPLGYTVVQSLQLPS